ncbi:hypothetical protein COU88_01045 [Candidatus Roizmanbacteria bacterium CG10_big_fil_rev_8_21_14_0_10_39_6]|uniref:GIY-YIG domain-containing protein n=1 Tax=Candidatus Roizmanbacteria bacterium CG10_big_fil_rev_8_21_14_0_10_39_6 TaxID=1974853 RepID=A0A2M8KTB2_9BACT|nr:MAG: hypothetical protein COU88_01045 [Candidatus Roizmanbacteria bacterium CG10_big_fil_rev_8_21_14_0_10_39_6]
MYYTYILKLSDGSYYIGYTSDLKNRLRVHNFGIVPSTKNFRPVKLLFYAAFTSQQKATDFEKYLKSSSGFAFRNKHFI